MDIFKTYLIAFLGIGSLLILQISVQFAWRKIFPEVINDGNAIEQHNDCHHCVSSEVCNNQKNNQKL